MAASDDTNAPIVKPPATAREFFNAGVKKLSTTNLADAEALFQAAFAWQDETVQPQALYNLGQVRFAEGSEELKKSPPPGQTKARSDHAAGSADGAILSAEAALAENDVQKMVDAYLRGRGARRELRAAYDAVQQALEEHGRTLQKWRRAMGDFQGAAELKPADTNAAYNVSVVEQNIAALVDRIRQMQMAGAGAAQQGAKLKDLLSKLKGKIPGDQMPPGAPGEDGEDDPDGHSPEELRDTAEGVSKDGKEMEITLSPEEAGNLLNGFQLGGDRQLPMAKGDAGQPKDRKLRDW